MNVPHSRKLPKNPRRLSGEYSAMNVIAPAYSPPVEKPCTTRQSTSRIGAQMPIEAYGGMKPSRNVPIAIMMTVIERTLVRPIRSPSGPKNSPPSGRTRNDTAKPANTPTCASVGLSGGKKFSSIVVAR